MSDGTYVGRVKHVGALMEYGGSGFKKRLLVLTNNKGNRERIVPFEITGDALKLPMPQEGDTVEVDFVLRGREWNGKYFVNLGVENISVVSNDVAKTSVDGEKANVAMDEPMVGELQEELPW